MINNAFSYFVTDAESFQKWKLVQAYLRDMAGSVPNHHNKVRIAIKLVAQFFFSGAYKTYGYTIL